MPAETPSDFQPEPRWPAIFAVVSVGGLHWALPEELTLGPSWGLLVLVLILLIPTMAARRAGRHFLNQILGYALATAVTVAMIASLALLVHELPEHKESPKALLQSAAALWMTNILVFASWYWRLDAGGPNARERRARHRSGAFLFPQMTLITPAKPDGDYDFDRDDEPSETEWRPGFVDYLFLAFNTSTAFSPTDVPVLSRWAKILMMIQATISFTTVALLAARAVNIL